MFSDFGRRRSLSKSIKKIVRGGASPISYIKSAHKSITPTSTLGKPATKMRRGR